MTRMSAASIKGKGSGTKKQRVPREGSMLRYFYDKLVAGEEISLGIITTKTSRSAYLRQLKDYDLELVHRDDPTAPNRGWKKQLYRCVGIWDGDTLKTLEDVQVALENTVLPE